MLKNDSLESNKFYLPELDVLRFVAFLWVFITHGMDLSPIDKTTHFWGYHLRVIGVFGVPIFFTLSAFLISSLLLKELDNYGKLDVKSFYIRRILRIWPLYFLVLLLIVILTMINSKFGAVPHGAYLPFLLFSGNWYISLNEWINCYPLNPLWSISVEEQFYILIPLIILWKGKQGLKIFAIAFFIFAYAWIVFFALNPTKSFTGEWTNSFVQFQFFSIGIFLTLIFRNRSFTLSPFLRITLFLLGIVAWLVCTIVFKVRADSPHLSNVPEAIFGWFLMDIGVIAMFLSFYGLLKTNIPNPLIYLGKISYGLYMFHAIFYFLVFVIFKKDLSQLFESLGLLTWKRELSILMAFLATAATASLTYFFFEKPFLKLKQKFTHIKSRL